MILHLLVGAAGLAGLVFLHALERHLFPPAKPTAPPAAPAISPAAQSLPQPEPDPGPHLETDMNLIGIAVLAGRLTSAGVAADKVLTIATAAVQLMHDAEDVAKELKAAPQTVEGVSAALAGADKLAAVRDGLWAVIQDLGLGGDAQKIWSAIQPGINLLVRIYKAVGLFVK